MSIALNKIPGIAEALAEMRLRQVRAREDAWLGMPKRIAGFRVRTMTARDYVILEKMSMHRFKKPNPFLNRLMPTITDLTLFLWALSPQHEKWMDGVGWRRKWLPVLQHLEAFYFARRARKKIPPAKFADAIKKSFAYINEIFSNQPPSSGQRGESGLCYLDGWFDQLQNEHHLTTAEIWRMPLPVLFGRLAAIQTRKRNDVPAFNRFMDAVKAWVQNGLCKNKFTYEDLKSGRIRFDISQLDEMGFNPN